MFWCYIDKFFATCFFNKILFRSESSLLSTIHTFFYQYIMNIHVTWWIIYFYWIYQFYIISLFNHNVILFSEAKKTIYIYNTIWLTIYNIIRTKIWEFYKLIASKLLRFSKQEKLFITNYQKHCIYTQL